MGDENKFIKDIKLFIALWENTAINLRRSNVIESIEKGADVNVRFAHNANNTPLHIAVAKGDQDIVSILLSYGAKVNIPNDAGKTALQLAKELSECSDIVEILIEHEERRVNINRGEPLSNKALTATKYEYKKRPGTANVRGQLYETKLLTTVYLRALRCKQILEFYLGTNVDEIGDLDDVCLRLKTKTKDIAIFLQAKYRHDIVKGRLREQELWEPNCDFSLLKYFDSYTRIRKKFHPDSTDVLCRGRYEDIIPYFVIYTTVKDEIKNIPKKASADNMVHDLLGTGENRNVFQLIYEEQHVNEFMNVKLIEHVKNMGKKLIKIILSNKIDNMIFCDVNIRNFHVILAQKVIKLTDVNSEEYRTGTFREEFFYTEETLLIELRKTLYAEIVKNNNLSVEEIEASLYKISIEPTADSISDLIGSVLIYNSNSSTLKLSEKATGKWYSYQNILDSIQVAKSEINEAFQIAGRKKLQKLVFTLPAAFGNIDMTITKKKINGRLEILANKICDAIESAADEEGNVIIQEGVFSSDKKLESGILDINGGIAGAVGNLFVSDNDTKLKFNLDINSLGENARKLHLILKERLKDLSRYRFDIAIEDFPRFSMQATEYEKRHVRDFLKNLYFYTCQAKEENLEEIATKELQAHKAMGDFSRLESRIRSNAIFLKIHNEIQIWWMIDQSVYYLTRNMEMFETIFSYFKNKGLLTFLNIFYMKDSYNTGLEFKSDAVDVLSVCDCESHDQRMIVVLTEAYMLTSLKFMQFFKDNDNCYIFIDIDYICRVIPNCFDTIFTELSETVIPIVIIVCKDTSKSTYRIVDMIRGCVAKKIILVTTSYDKKDECIVMNDDKINLSDLTNESQYKILQTQFLYQGVEITFAEVFDQAKHLISPMILQKIMRNEQIVLGHTLETSVYEDMKNYYVPRVLEPNMTILNDTYELLDANYVPPSCENSNEHYTFCQQFSPSTLVDHIPQNNSNVTNSNFVLILDAPGMGKSTLLTHLSIETKQRYPKIWIQRINLAEHTKQFYEWQENNVEIDHMEALKFLCDVAVCKDVVKGDISNSNIDIKLQIVDDVLSLIGCGENFAMKLLEFKTFLDCFEQRNIVFLFDGFDEIAPHYKSSVIQLLKCLAHNENVSDMREELQTGFCVWITSRPYNDLKMTLEGEFGISYTLSPFSYYDTYVFVDKYMKRNLNLTMLDQEQLMNIYGFFEYMKRFDLRSKKQPSDTLNITNVQLHGIYMAAVEYLKNEIKLNSLSDSLAYVKHWDFQEDVLMVWNLFKDEDAYTNATTLSGVPLNLYIAIHYLLSQIKDTSIVGAEQRIQKWDLNTNTFAFYERFLEAKLKRRFEEKNRMNMFNPDVKMTCEREMKVFREKHMQLGFYTVFEKDVFTVVEFTEVQDIVKSMEIGHDKNGLVDRIINGKPKFIHYTFAEYFAVEHIFEILKNGEVEKQMKVLDCILNNMLLCQKDGFQVMFDLKLKCTPGFVNEINNSFLIYQHIFRTLVQQNSDMSANMSVDYSKSHTLPYLTVLDIAVNEELMHLAEFLIDAVINVVDETNISEYVLIIENGKSLPLLVDKTYNTINNEITGAIKAKKNLMNKIVNGVTRVDATKVYNILNSLWLKCRPPF